MIPIKLPLVTAFNFVRDLIRGENPIPPPETTAKGEAIAVQEIEAEAEKSKDNGGIF